MKRQHKLLIIGALMMLISAAPGLVYRIFFAPKLSVPTQINQLPVPVDYQLKRQRKISNSHPLTTQLS